MALAGEFVMASNGGPVPFSPVGAKSISIQRVMWHLLAGGSSGSADRASERAADVMAIHAECDVLVVDDDLVIRETVAALLEDDGYSVQKAANGLEALASIERRMPRVVLLDMRLPLMDGWGFVDELRQRDLRVAVVAMTATHDARTWAEEIGATRFIGKPFDPEELLTIVDSLCRGDEA
jgi:CheY-like chemotaxis protein